MNLVGVRSAVPRLEAVANRCKSSLLPWPNLLYSVAAWTSLKALQRRYLHGGMQRLSSSHTESLSQFRDG
jgi:hypothetical protein